jgi:hypothetical protein
MSAARPIIHTSITLPRIEGRERERFGGVDGACCGVDCGRTVSRGMPSVIDTEEYNRRVRKEKKIRYAKFHTK